MTPYYPDIMNRSNKAFWQRKVRARVHTLPQVLSALSPVWEATPPKCSQRVYTHRLQHTKPCKQHVLACRPERGTGCDTEAVPCFAVLGCAVLCCVQACVIKVHMLMLAHLERLGDEVPAALQADLR